MNNNCKIDSEHADVIERCSTACIKVGSFILVLVLIELAILQQLNKQESFINYMDYVINRYKLSEKLKLLDSDLCISQLKKQTKIEDTKILFLDQLNGFQCFTNKEIILNIEKNDMDTDDKVNRPYFKTISVGYLVIDFKDISSVFAKLIDEKLLTKAREYNNYSDITIYKWDMYMRNLIYANIGSQIKKEVKESIPNEPYELSRLTYNDMILISKFEFPEYEKVEKILESNQFEIPFLSKKFRVIDAILILEIINVFSVTYFWLFWREAIQCNKCCKRGTIFSILTKDNISITFLFILLLFTATIPIFLGIKTWDYNRFNMLLSTLNFSIIAMLWAKTINNCKFQTIPTTDSI